MSHTSPEIDCNCDRRIQAGREERGDIEKCIDCGRHYLILNGEEVWLEELDQVEREQEAQVDERIREGKERNG